MSMKSALPAKALKSAIWILSGPHPLREQPRRLARVAPEELHHEERAAEGRVAADALDHLRRRAPDAVRLEAGAHVPAVDAVRALERRARPVLGLGDDHQALLR